MKSAIIILPIIFLILLGGIFAAWQLKEKELSREVPKANLSIYSIYDNNQIKTGYYFKNRNIKGNTSKRAFIREKVDMNSSVTIINKNIKGQNFYTTTYKEFVDGNKKVKLELEKPAKLEVSSKEWGDNIRVNISSNLFKNTIMCLRYSLNFLDVNLVDYPRVNRESYDKCYKLETIKNSKNLTIKYSKISELEDKDYINLFFIDRDYYKGELRGFYEDRDLFGKNVEYVINNKF